MDEDDDGPPRTTSGERQVWAGLVTVVVSSAVYYVYLVPELRGKPVAEISWVAPMIWAMVAGVIGTIVAAIVLEVVVAVRRRDEPREPVHTDVRDREIGRRGVRASGAILGAGMAGSLILAMADADSFWIGNALFLCGLAVTVAEAVTKLYLYRRGF